MKKQTHKVVSYTLNGLLEDFFVLVFRDEKRISYYLGHQELEEIMFMTCCARTLNEQEIVDFIEEEVEGYIKEYVRAYTYWNDF